MRLRDFEIFNLQIPMRIRVRHHIAARSRTNNLILKMTLENGVQGYGECIPRRYVTGETIESVCDDIESAIMSTIHKDFSGFDDVVRYLRKIEMGCGKSALELAMLDAYGRHFRRSISSVIPGRKQAPLYSGVIPMLNPFMNIMACFRWKRLGIRDIKVKVGDAKDERRMRTIRMLLPKARIRIDCNCAWSAEETLERLEELTQFHITAVEQPVGKDDIAGLRHIRMRTSIPVIADESLCTMADAKELVRQKACDIFDIRVSKNGGILNSLELISFARKNGIDIMIGSQVGESGILSTAGRLLAEKVRPVYTEGSFDAVLLKDNITRPVVFGRHGIGTTTFGYGLGVDVDEDKLMRYSRRLR